jgi:hypothetical protein
MIRRHRREPVPRRSSSREGRSRILIAVALAGSITGIAAVGAAASPARAGDSPAVKAAIAALRKPMKIGPVGNSRFRWSVVPKATGFQSPATSSTARVAVSYSVTVEIHDGSPSQGSGIDILVFASHREAVAHAKELDHLEVFVQCSASTTHPRFAGLRDGAATQCRDKEDRTQWEVEGEAVQGLVLVDFGARDEKNAALAREVAQSILTGELNALRRVMPAALAATS